MKKYFFPFMLILLMTNKGFSQIPFYDAASIRDNCVNPGTPFSFKKDTVSIGILTATLRNYLPAEFQNSSMNDEQLLEQFTDNPFFGTQIQALIGGGNSSRSVGFLSKAASSLGGLDVTTFADGLAKFLIKRSKEELYVSFFENFHDKVLKNYPEFVILFPHTTLLVNNFQSWEYANIINTLREAFDKDMKEILQNLPKILTIDTTGTDKDKCDCSAKALKRIKKIQVFFATNPGAVIITGAFFLASEFISGKKVPVIIDDIAGQVLSRMDSATVHKQENLVSTIKLLKIINNSIRNTDANSGYVSIADLKLLIEHETSRLLFSGLLYEQIKNDSIRFNGTNLADAIKTKITMMNGVIKYVKNFQSGAEGLSNSIKNLRNAKDDDKTDLSEYWSAIFESVKQLLPGVLNVELIDPSITIPVNVKKMIEASGKAIEIAQDISVRNYSAVVIDILGMIPKNDSTGELKEFIVKYGSFAANVVEAKNSDDVENAIEAIALPVGSASIKKNTTWSIGLNGYLGGFFGNEYLSEKKESKWRPISGVYAPVGIAISKGFGKKYGSLSLFISVIDLGAVASFRLVDDSTEKLPKLTLQNIFAPGAGLIYGVPKWPVSIGYSYQLGPMVRAITADKVVSDKPNQRWQFFLAVDIPLINFYTKTKH